jgi:hypothetical protein
MEYNMRQLFPEHDLEIAPDGFAKFTRVEKPTLVYDVFNTTGYDNCGCEYESDGEGGFRDVWKTTPMSDEEKAEKISATKNNYLYPSWIFNEPDCTMQPPVEYPEDGKEYRWDEDTVNWVEMTNVVTNVEEND